MYFLVGFVSKEYDDYGVTVSILSNAKNPKQMLDDVCKVFDFSVNDLLWCREDLNPPSWCVYRIDEHGNEYIMDSFIEKKAAQIYISRFENSPHKQKYFIAQM